MKINLNSALKDGFLIDKYCDGADDNQRIEGVPYINFPFTVELQENKKYLSWILIDYDSNPVVSFSWIHWLVANYEARSNYNVEEGLVNSSKTYIGGVNTFASPLANIVDKKVIHNYGGPTPPDKEHAYTLVVYAHNEKLNLNEGFYLNELYNELEKIDCIKQSIKIDAKCYQ